MPRNQTRQSGNIDGSWNYKRPPLYPKQRQFVDCNSRYTIIEASSKAGKTVACIVWLFEQAIAGKPDQHFWWLAPIYSQARIAYQRLVRWLRESGLPNGSWQANETQLSITIAGRIIEFKGSDNPDSLYGQDVCAAIIDEASRCKEAAWHAIRSTLTATRGPVKIIGNVRGRKNWAYILARKAESGDRDMAYFKLTAWDAVEGGVLDAEEVEDAQRTLPDHVFKELYLAEPSDDGGNPFGIDAIRKCIAPMAKGPVCHWGVDLAKSYDWTVACGLNTSGYVCALERWQSDWGQTRRRLIELIGRTPASIDSTGVGDPVVEDLIRECPYASGFKFTSTSKQQIIEGLAASIQQQAIQFPEGWLTAELESFEYQYHQGGVRYSAPDGLHDDGVCALALANELRRRKAVNRVKMEFARPVVVN